MSAREVVWFPPAVEGLTELLRRRDNPRQVQNTLGQHLNAVAGDLSISDALDIFEGETRTYRFHCPDGKAGVYIQVDLEVLPNNLLAVTYCGSVAL